MMSGAARVLGVFVASLAAIAAPGAQSPAPSASVTAPADSVLEARTAEVASTLRCPVCQGESIQDSPAELAQQMRAIVKEKLRNGETPEQIERYFVARYGEWILLEPAMTGLNVLLYVVPVALVLGGLAIVFLLVRRWTAPEPATSGASPAHTAAPAERAAD